MSAPVLTWKHLLRVCLMLVGILIVLSFVALLVGGAAIPATEVGAGLWAAITRSPSTLTPEHSLILFTVRLPRLLLAILVGAALAVAGAAYQALLRNPLADPYVLGVSSGAALGTILSLALAARITVASPVAAFIGATLTIAAVYFLGQRGGQLAPYTLLLAGVITASFLSAIITFLLNFLSARDLRGATFWLMGDLSSTAQIDLRWLGLFTLAAIGVIYSRAAELNLLLSGEQEAESLGVNVRRTKFTTYLAASLATGLAVSVSGAIGYVGLLVPHLVRLLFGSDYRLLVPASALGGAVVLVAADTLARTVVAPTELPSIPLGWAGGSTGRGRTVVSTNPSNFPCLDVRRLAFSYGHFRLEPLNFSLSRGELLAIIGPNASGKSTLLKLLAGLLSPDAGAVLLDGQPVNGLGLRERAQRIAVVQQESPLYFPIRALPFVLQGRHPHMGFFQLENQPHLEVARSALLRTRTNHLTDRLVQQLSGGEKQRLILARALSQEPELLLLDEPTLHLDIGFQVELLRLVQTLARREQYAVVLVSHELNLAAEFADSVLLLHQGRLVRYGRPADVYDRDLLEEVFQTELDIFLHPESGRPRVVLRTGEAEMKGGEAQEPQA
jgi:iron complex transport system permease protein